MQNSVVFLLCAECDPRVQEGNCSDEGLVANCDSDNTPRSRTQRSDCDDLKLVNDFPPADSSRRGYIQHVTSVDVGDEVSDTNTDGQSNASTSQSKSRHLSCNHRLPPDNGRQGCIQNVHETGKGLSTYIDGYVNMSTPNGTALLPKCTDHHRTVNVRSRRGCGQNVHEMVDVLYTHTDSYGNKCPSDGTTRLLNSDDRKPINEEPLVDSRHGCDQSVLDMDEVISTNTDSYSQNYI